MNASKGIVIAGVMLVVCAGTVMAAEKDWVRHPVSLKLGPGVSSLAVHGPADLQITPDLEQQSLRAGRPIPIGGFIPYVAYGFTDAHETGEFLWEHYLTSYVHGTPLIEPLSENYGIGTLDTGATMHLSGYCQQANVGLSSENFTGLTIPIGGASGQIDAEVTYPMGVYMTGFQDIDAQTGSLDTSNMRGHWQVSIAALPAETCGDGADVSTVIGMPLIPFCDIEIRSDKLCIRDYHEKTYIGPEVNVLAQFGSTLEYPTVVPLDVLPGGKTTVAYYPDIGNMDFETPWIPSALCEYPMAIPTGAWFYAGVELQDGTSSEITNKLLMFDTGAQVSVIRSFLAGQLGLDPGDPDFEVEILGASGDIELKPGFFIDSFEIVAYGGTVLFESVPVVVLDMTSIDGTTLEGIIGMNVFYNRSLALKPALTGGSILEVSDPVTTSLPGDFNQDMEVDLEDFIYFDMCLRGPGVEPEPYFPCVLAFDFDEDGDVDLEDFGGFQMVFEGTN